MKTEQTNALGKGSRQRTPGVLYGNRDIALAVHGSGRAFLSLATLLGLLALPVAGTSVTWQGGVNTTWDQPDLNSFSPNYSSLDDVTFGDTGVGT